MELEGLFKQVGKRLWKTTRPVIFDTRYGPVRVPQGFHFDKFTGVADTEHIEFQLGSLLHDYTRRNAKNLEFTREMTDLAFRDELLLQSFNIFAKMRTEALQIEDEQCRREAEIKAYNTLWSLLHRARVYYKGVSGFIGSLFIIFKGGL